MGWRGLVATGALLATGIVGGFAAAAYLEPDPTTTGAPRPVTAADPSVPTIAPAAVEPDSGEDPLKPGLPMRQVSIGTGKNEFVFPAPVGWVRLDPSSNEVKYKLPGNHATTYVLRVEQVKSQHETIPDILLETKQKLSLNSDLEDYETIAVTHDSLRFSYVYQGFRRFGFITWLDLSRSGQAEAEIGLTGREVDVPGMDDLNIKVIRGIRAADQRSR